MSDQRGIIGSRGSTAPRPDAKISSLAIAIVLVVPGEAKLHYFDSPEKALEYFEESIHASGGNWEKYLNLWNDRFPVTVPVLISTAEYTEDASTQKSNTIIAINNMKNFMAEFGVRPDVTTVPDFPRDVNIMNSLKTINQFFKCRSWYDIDATTGSEATLFRNESGSERISMVNSALGTYTTETNQNEWYDGGTCMAFHRAFIDSQKEFGWFDSISNVPINMDAVKNKVVYHDGQDEADAYATIQVWIFIKDGGIRPWGSDYTCSSDALWQNGSRVRLVDLAIQTMRKSLRDNIDKDINNLSVAKQTLTAYKNMLIGQGIMLGGEIELDIKKTTPTEVTAGNFYFIFDFQDAPKTRKMVINMNYVDRFSNVAYKLLEVSNG